MRSSASLVRKSTAHSINVSPHFVYSDLHSTCLREVGMNADSEQCVAPVVDGLQVEQGQSSISLSLDDC